MKKGQDKYIDEQAAAALLKNTGASDFEEAISVTKFGKFNLLLILTAIPSGWATTFETTSMSYVFPAAQCDLSLSLDDKGALNAVVYLGMVSSAFVWGYLCDTLGRRKLLCIGYFLDTVVVLTSAFSQTITVLMISKFLGGFIISGPYAALVCYLSELHSAKYRARLQIVMGIIFIAGTICLPLLSALILPKDIDIVLFNYFRMRSWNILLLVCALPSFMGGICFLFILPESPKFLMSVGRNEEALNILKTVFESNTGKPAETYPITRLIEERQLQEQESLKKKFLRGFRQLKPLIIPPYLQNIILVCGLQMSQMISYNTLRLWLPQFFQVISDYEYYNNNTSVHLCKMLDIIRPKNVTEPTECIVNTNIQVYLNASIISSVSLLGYIITGLLINYVGKKKLIILLATSSGFAAYCMYFARSSEETLALSTIFMSVGGVNIHVISSVVVDLFPTSLRTMAISLTMMTGRMGTMFGNFIFPTLIKLGCAPLFFTIGTILLGLGIFSMLLPNTDMKPLQ